MALSSSVNKVLIINLWGNAYSGFSKGELNKSFCELSEQFFKAKGCEIKKTSVNEEYNVDEEIEKYQWADFIFYQSPTNWMGTSWQGKKYLDDVWTPAMDGRLCTGDGRTRTKPEDNYGTSGSLKGKYMLSVNSNAPKGSFDRKEEFLFEGRGVDDLWFPFHANQKFFGLEKVPGSTFASYDVLKNPTIQEDHERFKEHMEKIWNLE